MGILRVLYVVVLFEWTILSYIRKKLVEEIHRSPMECNGKQDGQMHEKVCDLVVFPMEKTSKASREASDCKSPSWPRKALPTHYSSLPRPKGKKVSVWTKTKATSLCYYHTYQFLKLFNLLNKMFILSLILKRRGCKNFLQC